MPTISHYDILEKLGEGGMGVVWKARDVRLERLVALKLLPPAKTAVPARRLRFAQEAKAASALNHPNIITIYEIDRTEGPEPADFIAMEFVPGRTLDQTIPAKGLRIGDALKYAIQIAGALAAAHAAGIVHRDLKPANVMVTEKGDVKVLDFGLAKLVEGGAGISEAEGTRTIAVAPPNTEDGTILGTAPYMSPEQAEGKKIDARSDIFSFGALLYEMLTGRRAFQADTRLAILAAILNREPESMERLNAGIPRELVRLVQRCLRKDVERRAHSMQDLKLALEEIKEDSDSGLTGQSAVYHTAPKARSRRPALYGAGAALVLGSVAFWVWNAGAKSDTALRAVPLTTSPGVESAPSFSPDGGQMAFAWNGAEQNNFDIYVQVTGSGRPLRLTTNPALDVSPVWSPDGRSIAFVRLDNAGNATLLVVPALGGPEREVTTLGRRIFGSNSRPRILGGWTPDSRWLLAGLQTEGNRGLFLISVETGEKRQLTTISPGFDYASSISADGRTVAFARTEGATYGNDAYPSDLFTVAVTPNLQPGAIRRLTTEREAIYDTTWSGDGSEIFFSSRHEGARGLWRVSVSGGTKPRRGPAGDNANTVAYSAHANRLVYEQVIGSDTNIWRVDLSGTKTSPTALIASTREDSSPVYSADGTKIAFRSDRSGSVEVWTCDADGSNAVQLTNRPSSGSPNWAPDGSQIAFDSQVDGLWQIFTIPARGGQLRQITTAGGTRPSWSHDGKWIYHQRASKIWKVPADGGGSIPVTKRGNNPLEGDDGTTLYYTTPEGIARASMDGSGEALVVANADANAMSRVFAVTRNGIYYQSTVRELRFYDFAARTSRVVFQQDRRMALGITVSLDGHWLLYTQIDGEPGSDLMLVENFR